MSDTNVYCNGITRRGTQCKRRAYKDGLCEMHHPDTQETQRKNRSKAGQISRKWAHNPPEPIEVDSLRTAVDVEKGWRKLAQSLMEGKIDHNTASAADRILKNLHKSYSDKKDARDNPENMPDGEMIHHIVESCIEAGIFDLLVAAVEKAKKNV